MTDKRKTPTPAPPAPPPERPSRPLRESVDRDLAEDLGRTTTISDTFEPPPEK